MPNTNSTLGSKERLFLASLAGKDKRVFRFRDALPYWASTNQTRKALSRLAKKGWIKRLARGLYLLIPLEAGPEGQWSDDPLLIGTQLVSEGAIAYWTALHFWNLTEQVPRTVFIQTVSRRSSSQEFIMGVRYQYVTINPNRFFGIRTQSSSGMPFGITDREKTMVDACERHELCGGILHIAQALRAIDMLDREKLDVYLDRFNSGAVYKRLGYLVEQLDTPMPDREIRLAAWRARLTQGIAWLEPGGAQTGPVVTRWRIRVNSKTLEGINDL